MNAVITPGRLSGSVRAPASKSAAHRALIAAALSECADYLILSPETEPGFAGNTAQGATKPATVETGAVVQVPLFVEIGDVIKIGTRTGEYLSRV